MSSKKGLLSPFFTPMSKPGDTRLEGKVWVCRGDTPVQNCCPMLTPGEEGRSKRGLPQCQCSDMDVICRQSPSLWRAVRGRPGGWSVTSADVIPQRRQESSRSGCPTRSTFLSWVCLLSSWRWCRIATGVPALWADCLGSDTSSPTA